MTDTIPIEDLCFYDTETRAYDDVVGTDGDVNEAGTYRYAKNAFVVILTYAIGEGPVQCLALDRGFNDIMSQVPGDLWRHLIRVNTGEAWMAAWNAGFDRQAWNEGTMFYPPIKPEHVIDVMAQAVASNLPPSLEGAAQALRLGGKQDDGKALIKLFSSAKGGTPQSHPEEWAKFKSYAVRDTALLREVYRYTRPLPMREWEEYWASEHINDRGMAIDVEFCRKAAAVAELDMKRTNELLNLYTNGQIRTVMQHAALARWIYDALPDNAAEARELMVKEWDEEDENDIKPAALSLKRDIVTKLITWYEAQGKLSERDETILRVLQLREFGASAAPKKFSTMLRQNVDGELKGSYVWNGAQQTGRFSSKGVQVHNMTRSVIGKKGLHESTAIEMINDLEV